MWFKDFYFRKRRYIYVYCLIWFVGIFFIGQRQTEQNFLDTSFWVLVVMLVDAPVVFFTVFYIFQKYLTPKKIIPFLLLIGIANLLTVFVYYVLGETFGIGKFRLPDLTIHWSSIIFQIQAQTFTEIFHTIFIASLLLGTQYYDFKRKYLELENEKAQAELQLLRAQINPHFLFNNLNVLSALIKKDITIADEFITRFSKLYRYLLKSKNKDFVSLSEELDFLNDYVYILKKRFGDAYQIDLMHLKKEEGVYSILPASLQGLIENAVKHNEGLHAKPLKIEMQILGDFLVVKNKIRPKFSPIESIGSGLKNLNMRYQMLTNTPIKILKENGMFEVHIPLIKSNPE